MSGNANVRRSAMFRSAVFVLLLWGLSNAPAGDAIWLNVPKTGTKCVSEEIQNNVVVLADYVVVSENHGPIPAISVKVTSPFGNTLHHKENATHGQFAFTTQEAGNYLACFSPDGHYEGAGELSVNIDWKTGIAAKDWESVARKEKIEGVELELRKLEGAVEAIHENLLYLKDSKLTFSVYAILAGQQRSRIEDYEQEHKHESRVVQYHVFGYLHLGVRFANLVLEEILSKEEAYMKL
ncbi:hypothetical protein V6N13_005384 [Hibiscus sabdariffa]|uniref:GOLD domain-containing protein n=1 Tax=Hibiscus sabdariffa TaxID=183260 RepID=A0ABR2EQT8_9ROSI